MMCKYCHRLDIVLIASQSASRYGASTWLGIMSQAERRPSVVLTTAEVIESLLDDLPLATVVVICDPDGARAAAVASRVTGHRTAVYVGDLLSEDDQRGAESMAAELFGRDGEVDVRTVTSQP